MAGITFKRNAVKVKAHTRADGTRVKAHTRKRQRGLLKITRRKRARR